MSRITIVSCDFCQQAMQESDIGALTIRDAVIGTLTIRDAVGTVWDMCPNCTSKLQNLNSEVSA